MSSRASAYARHHDGRRLYYELGGPEDAAPLLLIRGLGRSSRYWLDFREHLEAERRVLVFDNRGVGRSDTPPLFWTTRDMSDDVACVLRESGVHRADVFGISLGGMVAQHLALRHPHRVERLVLACTTPGGKHAARIRPDAALRLARGSRLDPRDAQAENARVALSPEYLRANPTIVDTWARIAASEKRDRRGLIGQAWAALRHTAPLEHLHHETLVMTGDADQLMPKENSERIAARLPRARLEYLRGAGHDFPTERPEETAASILAFFAGG